MPALEFDDADLRDRLTKAIENREDWLLHPFLSALSLPDGEGQAQRDFQLAIWTAAHSERPLGHIVVPEPLWLWTFDGGCAVSPGKYDLRDLAALIPEFKSADSINLDVFGRSIALRSYDTWSAQEPLSEEQQRQLNDEVLIFFRAMHVAALLLTDFKIWAASVTRVVIPFYGKDGPNFRSSSQPTIPGLVFCDISRGEVPVLEALAHESSHLHFFLAEAAGPLLSEQDYGLYKSPLRQDLRPLRGIFLAYHALAHICAFYVELLNQNIFINESVEKELNTLLVKLDEAERTLIDNQHLFTHRGVGFFDRTKKVTHYGKRGLRARIRSQSRLAM